MPDSHSKLDPVVDWPEQIFARFQQFDLRHVVYVPDAGHSRLIQLAQQCDSMTTVALTSEEEGIAYLAGAWLGGERGVLLMQSSGVGNCINLLSLQVSIKFPLLMLVTMRGQWAEFNPWHVPMGQATDAALQLMDVLTWQADRAADVDALLQGAATMAFEGDASCALLLGQRLIGEKRWNK